MTIVAVPNIVFVEVLMLTHLQVFVDRSLFGLNRFALFWHPLMLDRYSHCMRTDTITPPPEFSRA